MARQTHARLAMYPTLLSPTALGPLPLNNRLVLAPMTRCRTSQPGDVPNALMAEYYAQRASAGLLITEASQISAQGQGYSYTPGIYTPEQIAGWRLVTDTVHQAGGKIFLQLWHVGRMSHAAFQNGGLPVAPSAINPQAQIWLADEHGQGRMVDCPTPRALTLEEIPGLIADYVQAARNAMAAGFDGVEIHAANGYLLDQFLRTTANQRTDAYGGSQANRLRLLLEVSQAISTAIGAERVGVRLAPYITARGMACPDIIPTILAAATALDALNVAYLHLSEADWDDAPSIPEHFRRQLREQFRGRLICAGRYTAAQAESLLQAGWADLVAFGRPFIANPDLPARFANGWPLAQFDPSTLFGGDARGYTDYPAYAGAAA